MRIGIDARIFRASTAGIGRYCQNLVKNILELDRKNLPAGRQGQYFLFLTNADIAEADNLRAKNLTKVKINIPHYSLTEQTKFAKILNSYQLDLVHFTNFNHPVRYRGKFIVTIHDLTLLLFPGRKRKSFIERAAYKYVMAKAVKNSQKVIAVSNNTKEDIIKYFHTDPNKIQVIYEAADSEFSRPNKSECQKIASQYAISNKLLLYVGQWRPHKNLIRLLQAFAKIKKKVQGAQLALVGKIDPAYPEILKTIDKLGLKEDIILPGFVSQEELASFYKLAKVFVIPSLYEGFGLPGLEAMQSGVPVVASSLSSLPEVLGEAAEYFDPKNVSEMAEKISKVLTNENLQKELIAKGRKQVNKYSWQKTAEKTLNLYNEVLKP